MPFNILSEDLNGLVLIQPDVFKDNRGFFLESYSKSEFSSIGINNEFVQDNHSLSQKGVIRGMHFQWSEPMGKLIRIISGCAQVVELDIRKDSPSFGLYKSYELSESNRNILWVPPGFANGFLALSDNCHMIYKCTAYWNPKGESIISWKDTSILDAWRLNDIGSNLTPILSKKDSEAQTLYQWTQKKESNEFKY